MVCVFFIHQLATQAQQDSIYTNNEFDKAILLTQETKYDSAIILFTKALNFYKQSRNLRKYYECLNKISENLWRMSDFVESKKISEKVIFEFTEPKFERAEAFINLGIANEYLGFYDEALSCYSKAIIIQKPLLPDALPDLAKSYSNIGILYYLQNKYDSSLKYLYKTINISANKPSSKLVGDYNTIAMVYGNKHYYDSAMAYYNKALQVAKKTLGSKHQFVANILNNISIVYSNKGEHNLAIEYLQRSIDINVLLLGKKSPDIGRLYSNLGVYYQRKGNFSEALKLYRKTLPVLKKNLGNYHPLVGTVYYNLGIISYEQSDFLMALEYYKIALKIEKKNNKNSDHAAFIYSNFCKVYFKLNQDDNAMHYYKKSISIFKTNHGVHFNGLSEVHEMVGNAYFQKKRYGKSLVYCQKALIANSIDFTDTSIVQNPNTEKCLNPLSQLRYFYLKAKIFDKYADINPFGTWTKHAIKVLETCDTLVSILRLSHHRFKDKTAINKISMAVYNSLVTLNLRVFKSSRKVQYFEKAISYSEKSKSALLSQNLDDASLKFNDIIDSLDIAEEIKLSNDISYYQSQILIKRDEKDTVKLHEFENLLFESNYKKDSLLDSYKTKYPKYHQLRLYTKIVSLNDIQTQLLKENQALVEYFIGDSSTYIFAITKSNYAVKKIEIDSVFSRQLKSFRNVLHQPNLLNHSKENYKEYISVAHNLYNYLIAPVGSLIAGKELIIIPDGELALIPFEALLTNEANSTEINYQALPYLIKKHAISYANSATLLFNEMQNSKNSEESNNGNILAFAPKFENNLFASTIKDSVRSKLSPLNWTVEEVNNLSSYFNTKVYTNATATEKSFKQEAGNYSILHIASHGLVDDENPMYSKIAFTVDETDTLNDGYLHTFELYNTELNADMAVLSACNTGYGKVLKGEGVLNLARGFFYAGCKTVVMSLWVANDKSTATLMGDFYKYLAGDQPKNSALQHAKLDYIKSNEGLKAHPYYWSQFIISGEVKSISNSIFEKAKSRLTIILILTSFSLALFLAYKSLNTRWLKKGGSF